MSCSSAHIYKRNFGFCGQKIKKTVDYCYLIGMINKWATIAQLVEQGTENPCVLGSIPSRGTILKEALCLFFCVRDYSLILKNAPILILDE